MCYNNLLKILLGGGNMEVWRKVTGHENTFFMNPEANVALSASIKGKVSENEIRIAITKTARIHPLMRASIIENNSEMGYVINNSYDLPHQSNLLIMLFNIPKLYKIFLLYN